MPLRMTGKKGKGIQEISGTHMFHISSFMVNMPFTKPLFKDLAAAKSLQSCLTLQPHGRQPTRLPCPRDSPGKNTGVGCHFLLQCIKVKSKSEVVQSCPTLSAPWTSAHQAPLSMGFSRQECWSGVPLPSPI